MVILLNTVVVILLNAVVVILLNYVVVILLNAVVVILLNAVVVILLNAVILCNYFQHPFKFSDIIPIKKGIQQFEGFTNIDLITFVNDDGNWKVSHPSICTSK
ncbi:hypothetical protein ACFX5U_15425 [Sphingobacterium sp. SG20118]|uniref:hypothetical protein n=1 Tax=Sphingobacterium sp. SG20118 TaxID=3367156 RepID=UPI0037DFC5F7